MSVPICCGKRATPYHKDYGFTQQWGLCWEEGFRCKVCGAIRLPVELPPTLQFMGAAYRSRYEEVRALGMAFDATLTKVKKPPHSERLMQNKRGTRSNRNVSAFAEICKQN